MHNALYLKGKVQHWHSVTYINMHYILTLTIPDTTECNSLKKVMDVVALCISVVAVLRG